MGGGYDGRLGLAGCADLKLQTKMGYKLQSQLQFPASYTLEAHSQTVSSQPYLCKKLAAHSREEGDEAHLESSPDKPDKMMKMLCGRRVGVLQPEMVRPVMLRP